MKIIEALIAQRREHLENALRTCPEDNRTEARAWEDALDDLPRRANYLREHIPPAYLQTDSQHEAWNAPVYAAAVDWFAGLEHGDTSPRGLLLHGATGTCKTRTLYCLAAHFYLERCIRPEICRPGTLQIAVESSMHPDRPSMEDLMEVCQRAPVLMIDDLGKETMTARYQAFLFSLIEHRQAFEKVTVLTMNHTGELFEAKLKDSRKSDPDLIAPLMRRLHEGFLTINT